MEPIENQNSKIENAAPPLILWDGECGFCRRSAAWFVSHARHRTLQAIPYQQAPSPPMTPELYAACEHAVHIVLPDGRILRAGRALLFLMEQTGWRWLARVLRVPPLVGLVEWFYGIVAQDRPFFARFFFTKERPLPDGD
jgi:predicted DCC family thiol-disulfide oxidoreductase YuxK